MADIDYYNSYYRHQLDPSQVTSAVATVTTKIYLNRLLKLQTIGFLLLLSAIALQAVAIATNDWFVLNVNEYVQTAKGGLFYYCYLSNAGMVGKLDCFLYEKLPNFFVFANDRLFDSRVLLICSSGFLFVIMLIEISGIVCLRMSEKRGCDPFAKLLRKNSPRKFQILDEDASYRTQPIQTSTPTLKGYHKTQQQDDNFELNDEIQGGENRKKKQKTLKPIGYFAFLAISLLTMVGSVMEFVLKVSGFALFDSYITRLLSFNRVFMAYRSWSYWLMAGSILFNVIFWVFKVLATRYVVNLTKQLTKQDKAFSALVGMVRPDSGSDIVENSDYLNKKSIVAATRPPNPDRLFSVYNNNVQQNRYSNIIPQSIARVHQQAQSQSQSLLLQQQQQLQQQNKKSRQYHNGLLISQQQQQQAPRKATTTHYYPHQQQQKLTPYVYDVNIDNDDLETTNTSTMTSAESIDMSIMKNNSQFPSFPYIYRF